MHWKQWKGNGYLIIAALIWGLAFVAQTQAADAIGSFTLNGIRSLIGSAVLLPIAFLRGKKTGRPFWGKTPADGKLLLKAGVLCGVFLCLSVNLQQFGIMLYPPQAAASGRGGFITALYVVLVPLFGLFLKKKVRLNVWASVVLAAVGMYFLCFAGAASGVYLADFVVFGCAVCFCLHILCVDRFGNRVDGVALSVVQFLVCGILSCVGMLIFERPNFNAIVSAWLPILYMGICSSGIAYTLQILGQQYAKNPTVASILMSLESVFAALGGALILGEQLSLREILGCAIMFVAIVLAQLPARKKRGNH